MLTTERRGRLENPGATNCIAKTLCLIWKRPTCVLKTVPEGVVIVADAPTTGTELASVAAPSMTNHVPVARGSNVGAKPLATWNVSMITKREVMRPNV